MKLSPWVSRVLLCAMFALWGQVTLLAQTPNQAQGASEPQGTPLPARLSGFSDEGTFVRYVAGKPALKIIFKWQADGSFENRRVNLSGDQDVSGVTRITSDKDGRWVKIIIEGPNGTTEIARQGKVVESTFKGMTDTVVLEPGTTLFGGFAPALLGQAVRLYDRARGGKQVFPVFRLGTGNLVEASLEVKDRLKRRVGGRELEFARYVYRLPMVDFILWADADGKIYLAENAVDQSAFVREGYEALRQTPSTGPVSSGIKGAWQGVLDIGLAKFRLGLRIAQAPDGTYTAKLDSPDQGAIGIPVDTVTFQGQSVRVELKVIQGVYEGKLSPDESEIVGEWKQDGQASPLTFKRPDRVAKVNRPQEPKQPYPYLEEEVVYENRAAGVKLAGTLTLPRSEGPFPAVLLITGSGPQDRNETVMEHRPFLVLADYLTRQGIAVLRADDRGVGKSTGNFATATSEDFAGDALAGVAYLKSRREINPRQIGLIGHSEGGMIAPMVAARSTDVAFIVLLAGPGLAGEEIMYLQSGLLAKASGVSDEVIAQNRARLERIFAALKREKDPAVVEKLAREAVAKMAEGLTQEQQKALNATEAAFEAQIKFMTSPWFRFFVSYDPRPTLEKVKCPVLAINGERDLQVPPKEDLAAIARALKAGGNKDYQVVELPKLNHLFQTSQTGAVSEYHEIEETIAPVALQTMADWILKHTAKR